LFTCGSPGEVKEEDGRKIRRSSRINQQWGVAGPPAGPQVSADEEKERKKKKNRTR